MRKSLVIGLGAALALATAAVALAAVYTASGVSAATATFTAKPASPSDVKSRTCTGSDTKEFKIFDGRYAGNATFTAPVTSPAGQLDGDLTIRARTTVDTSSKLGYVVGSFSIKDADTRVNGSFAGTLNGTTLSGFLTGSSRGSNAKVLGTLSGTFDPATGLTGALGTGNIAHAVVAGPVCKGSHRSDGKSDHSRPSGRSVEGGLTAITTGGNPSTTTITVTPKRGQPVTCTVANAALLTGFSPVTSPPTQVEMKCESVGNPSVLTLMSLKKHT
jgi:hypothetical protein